MNPPTSHQHSRGDSAQTTSDESASRQKPRKTTLMARLRQLWNATGLTWPVYRMILKGALAPTVAIAAYQSSAWATQYNSIGFLVGVVAVFALVTQPRAQFLQSLFVHIIVATIAYAISLLASFSAVSARANSESGSPGSGGLDTVGIAVTGAPTAPYNSSAAAVTGIWLFAEIFVISVFRAMMPQYALPSFIWAIVANVSLMFAPQFGSMQQAAVFCTSMYITQLTGLAVSALVSLFVFPLTSREILFADMRDYIVASRAVLRANMKYLKSLENSDMFALRRTNTFRERATRSPEAEDLRRKTQALTAAQAKLYTVLPFAKSEIAVGKLGPDDLKQAFHLLREILVPAVGLNVMSDLFERISEEGGWDRSKSFANLPISEAANETEKARIMAVQEWQGLLQTIREPFDSVTELIDEGLQHVALTLRLVKPTDPRWCQGDMERTGDRPRPGDKEFTAYYVQRAEKFKQSKLVILQGWCQVHGIELPDDFPTASRDRNINLPEWTGGNMTKRQAPNRRQLVITVFAESLLYNISQRVYDTMLFADGHRDSGKISQARLVVPGYKRSRKWMLGAFPHHSRADEKQNDADDQSRVVRLGQAYKPKKDPEHLPPQTGWERFSNPFRHIAHFLASPEAHFGFRVATATISIAIVGYLRNTQMFFTQNRLVWAQNMVSIAMNPSTGQSLREYVLRASGTVFACSLSWVAWYAAGEHALGVIFMLYLTLQPFLWYMIRRPSAMAVGIIGQATLVLIVGYELQVLKVGIEEADAKGLPYFPAYQLAAIRLATVLAGLFVAFFWTVFPYPNTEHSKLRLNLGSALYLLANYYSVVHETLKIQLNGTAVHTPPVKGSPEHRLQRSRYKIFAKYNILLTELRAQSRYIKYDIQVGGKFPSAQYDRIIEILQESLNFMSLITMASTAFTRLEQDEVEGSEWLAHFKKVVHDAHLTSQAITSVLSLLSFAMTNKQALPPYLRIPEPGTLSRHLEELDNDILSVRHVAEPGYASFAVIQIALRCLIVDLRELLELIKELVGELDFSYHVLGANDPDDAHDEGMLENTRCRTRTGISQKEE